MSQKQKSIVWTMVLVVVVLLGTLAFVVGGPRRIANERKPTPPVRATQFVQSGGADAGKPRPRNLSLQPEAFKMARRLGQRFSTAKRERSILVGTLTIGSERRTVETTRTQTDRGEQVEVKIAGRQGSLTWDAGQGTLSAGSRATGDDRELVERLVLDSPDQFVLAQLRGASYYSVANNVMPEGAGGSDTYTGPVWDIVRLDDPDQDSERRPLSRWRLYYINSVTGALDRIMYQDRAGSIEANFGGWSDHAGEKVPSLITWSRKGSVIMELRLISFSHSTQL